MTSSVPGTRDVTTNRSKRPHAHSGSSGRTPAVPGADDRVPVIEDELRLAAGLTALREQAALSQRELAQRIGVSRPRVAAIERSRNAILEVLEQYVTAVGGQLEITVRTGSKGLALVVPVRSAPTERTPGPQPATRKRAAKSA